MAKYIGENALTYLITLIKSALAGKVAVVSGKGLSANDYTSEEKTKLAGVAANANNYSLPEATASTLGGVKVGAGLAVSSGVLSATGGGVADSVAWENVTGKPTIPSNNNQLTNGAGYQTASQVSSAIATAVASAYKASGSTAFAALPTPAAANLGNVYNVTDAFTTTASFVEGAGKSYPANTNVAVVLVSGSYKLDVLSGLVDLSGYLESADLVELTNTEVASLWSAQ